MTITQLSIKFDHSVYYPGQMITGRVVVAVDKLKNIKGVELKIKGRAKFKWTKSERYKNSEGYYRTRTITHSGKELYFRIEMKLVKGKKVLGLGVHEYLFAVKLPINLPSTFNEKYGGIAYYGKAKVVLPLFEFNKTSKNFFHVANLLDLNLFPHLKTSAKQENSKTFCCLFCTSGLLTMVVFIPKTGYTLTESVPITLEIDNASNVKIDCVKAYLSRKIHWKARMDSKHETDQMKTLHFGEVPQHSSKTWSKDVVLDCGPFPNIRNCNIISIEYILKVEADPSGVHTDLVVEIPLTIGDIPFCNTESVGGEMPFKLPVTLGFPQQINSDIPDSYMLPDGSISVNRNDQPNVFVPHPAGDFGPSSFPSAAHSEFAQPGSQCPSSPYACVNVGSMQPAANTTSAGFSDNFAPFAPSLVDILDGNSVTHYSSPVGSINSGFYDPSNANPSHNFNHQPQAFNASMPATSFFGEDAPSYSSKKTNARTQLLSSETPLLHSIERLGGVAQTLSKFHINH